MNAHRSLADSKQVVLEMRKTDLELALTFTQIAADPNAAADRRQRNVENAKKAYSTVSEWLERLKTSPEERPEIHSRMELLCNALVSLRIAV